MVVMLKHDYLPSDVFVWAEGLDCDPGSFLG